MLRLWRWLFALVGVVLLARAGISIFRAPPDEVLYTAGVPLRMCAAGRCVTLLLLELGNTGTVPQANVRVRFRAEPLRRLVLPVTVRNFGKVDRPVTVSEAGGERLYDLGQLEPQKRVELEITFLSKEGETVPSWPEILVGVEPATGEARSGDPALVTFARWTHAIFGWL